MTANPDDPALIDLAASVSDGKPLDWDEADASRILEDPALRRELQVLAQIADVHRSPERVQPQTRADHAGRRWGHLEIKCALGSGSFGTVYRAHDSQLERDVALKIYQTEVLPESHLASLFAEGRLLARVRHSNVVIVHGVERHGDEAGMWLELVDGRTLAEEVRQAGPVGGREAALVGVDLCRALAAVHQAGIVHGDVKPQNVMRERGGRIVLMDFGIGRDLTDPSAGASGTPLYMAPELFDGATPSPASDIYSLGVLLFYLVTGSHPVVANTRGALGQSHRTGVRRLLRDVRSDLPDAFVEVIDRACAPDPAHRYATAGALQAALTAAIGLSSGFPSAPGPVDTRRARTLRRSGLAVAAAVLLLAGAGGFAAYRSWTSPAPVAVNQARQEVAASRANLPTAPVSADPDEYRIRAGFRRSLGFGSEPLQSGARVAPGDRLFLEIDATRPVHVYVVNQDERGESYLLFPLPGQPVSNPLAAGRTHRLPGDLYWEVTTAGGREHFLVVASPEPLGALEAVFATLPTPTVGGPPAPPTALSQEAVGQLRGVGGLSPRRGPGPTSDLLKSAVGLSQEAESAKGPWMRQLTLENPAR